MYRPRLALGEQGVRCQQRPEVGIIGRFGKDCHDVDVAALRVPVVEGIRADDVQALDQAGRRGVDDVEVGAQRLGDIHASSLADPVVPGTRIM